MIGVLKRSRLVVSPFRDSEAEHREHESGEDDEEQHEEAESEPRELRLGPSTIPKTSSSTTVGTANEPNLTTTVIVPAKADAATIARNGSGEMMTTPSIIGAATPGVEREGAPNSTSFASA